MNIVFITRKFFPYGDATSGVVGNLAKALVAIGNNVKVIAVTETKLDSYSSTWNDIDVSFIYAPGLESVNCLKSQLKTNPFKVFISFIIKVYSKLIMKINMNYRRLSLDPRYIRAYKKAIKCLDQQYDLCLVTLMPQEAAWTAVKYCGDLSKVAIYQLDTYWNNEMLSDKYQNHRMVFERFLADKCRFFLTTPQIQTINEEIDTVWGRLLTAAEFPVVQMPQFYNTKESDSDKTHCVFLGTLYPDIRPPEKIVSVISKMSNSSIVFDFYGNNQELIVNAKDFSSALNHIVLHGMVPSDEAQDIRNCADILLNIDNTCSNQVPSKIFEYISTGKPIINFYFNHDSCVLKYLSEYPLSLNICVNDDFSKSAEMIDLFINSLNGDVVPFSMIEEIYYKNTPGYVAKLCIETYKNSIKERETK